MDSSSWTIDELRERLLECRQCGASGYYIGGPPLVRNGSLPAPIFVLGQAPAAIQAQNSATRPFSPGRHGQPSPLWSWLEEAGWPEECFRASAYMTAVTRCYPGPAPGGSGDRRPTAVEQAFCRPYWQRELVLARPEVILTLGTMALSALGLRQLRLQEAVGQVYDRSLPHGVVPIIPLPHPSGVSRWLNDPAHRALLNSALQHLRERTEHLVPLCEEKDPSPL